MTPNAYFSTANTNHKPKDEQQTYFTYVPIRAVKKSRPKQTAKRNEEK